MSEQVDVIDLLLEALQAELWHRVKSDEVLCRMPVLRDRVSSTTDANDAVDPIDGIEAQIIQNLSTLNEGGDGKTGSCIVVERPELETENINLAAPMFDVTIVVRVIVNPLLNNEPVNGRRMSEGQISLRILRLGHFWKPGGVAGVVTVDRKALVAGSDLPDGHEGYDVTFRTRAGLAADASDKVATPSITFTNGICTVACTTADAIVRYTTEGSAPAASNDAAEIYDGPFVVESGTRVRAAAQLAGKIASDTHFKDAP